MKKRRFAAVMTLAVFAVTTMIYFLFTPGMTTAFAAEASTSPAPAVEKEEKTPEEKTPEIIKGKRSEIDVTNKNDGYIRVRYLNQTPKKIKVRVSKGTMEYTYNLPGDTSFTNFPLQMGNGEYTIKVFENIDTNRYSVVQTAKIDVTLTSEFAPYLVSVQNINFSDESKAIKKAAELTKDIKDELKKVEKIYSYIVNNIKYDYKKAENLASGYLPKIDDTIETNLGICYDYSSLLASMLRSLGLPTKMIFGYVPSGGKQVYHAWNEVFIAGKGWIRINGSIYFDGKNWSRVDSTFAASNSKGNLTKFIGNGSNYKYDREF